MARELKSSRRWLHVFGSFERGGAEVRTARLMGALGRELEHVLVSLDGSFGAVGGDGGRLPGVITVSAPPGTAGSSVASMRFVRRVALEQRATALLTYGWGAFDGVFARCVGALRVPCVHHEDGFTLRELARPPRRRDLARRLCLPRISGLVVPSTTLRDHAVRRWGVPPSRVHHLPNGVPPAGRAAATGPGLRKRLGIEPDATLVVVLGRLAAVKRVELAVEACSRGGLVLVVIGDGPERPRVEAAARAHGGRCHLLGDSPAPRPLLQEADIYLSTSASEQHPLAMLEAMDAGLPVVATAVGDVALTLPACQREHLLPATANADAFTSALHGLARDEQLRRRLGARNRERARARYSSATTTAEYAQVVGALLDSTSR